MLESACHSLGIEPISIRHAPDDRESLRNVLALSLAESDLLITAGGISTGEYDFVQEELSALGVVKKFWNVSQKPGKPLYFGSTETGCAVFSLPGNPVSAMVCFVEYCIPSLLTLQGKASPGKFSAVLTEPFPSDKKRHRFLLGTVWAEEGQLLCRTSPKCESHMITAITGSNCLIEAGPSTERLPAGAKINCTILPWAGLH
jgi:molybdopterin molybdotransferase